MKEDLVLVIDLDGTLVSEEISERIYKEAYMETLERVRERGIEIPAEFHSYSFKNYCELTKKSKMFNETYKEVYERVWRKYIDGIRREKERAKVIYGYLINRYRPRYVFILTANPKGDEIIDEILPEIRRERVLIVNGNTYVEDKKTELEKLKNLGRVLYVADRDELDFVAAKEAGVDYINVYSLVEELGKKEKDLYKLEASSP